jgi:hypothetical protein
MDQRGERHVAAVGAAHHRKPLRVELRSRPHEVQQRADVLDRIFAFFGIVEREIGLAVAVGAAHVRLDHRDAGLADQILNER